MGNTQILLLVLGMIIVGVIIAVAIVLVNENAISANRDAMTNDLINIAARAQQYYNTPSRMGGGGRSYVGLTADDAGMAKLVSASSSTNTNGVYSVLRPGTSSQVVLQGVGSVELSDGSFPTLWCIIRPGNAQIVVEN